MKNIALILLVLIPAWSEAQCGISGDTLVVVTSEDLNSLNGCTEIQGSLLLSNQDWTNIDALAGLQFIEEHLILNGNISLQSLAGLAELTEVGGNLELRSNFTLQDASGMHNLQSIGGDFILDGNITLESTSGWASLNHIGGDVVFGDNHVLSDLTCFSGFDTFEGSVVMQYENFILNDLSGLSTVSEIGGDLVIELPGLTDVEDLVSLESVLGNLEIRNIPLIGTLSGLESLRNVGDSLKLENNDSMVSINALAGLDQVGGSVEITGNNALMLCCTLENWVDGAIVSGEIFLDQNHASCNDLEDVMEVCEPLSSGELEAFIPGVYEIRSFDLTGRQQARFDLFLERPFQLYRMKWDVPVVIHARNLETGQILRPFFLQP